MSGAVSQDHCLWLAKGYCAVALSWCSVFLLLNLSVCKEDGTMCILGLSGSDPASAIGVASIGHLGEPTGDER